MSQYALLSKYTYDKAVAQFFLLSGKQAKMFCVQEMDMSKKFQQHHQDQLSVDCSLWEQHGQLALAISSMARNVLQS